jgi:hypothetical protein
LPPLPPSAFANLMKMRQGAGKIIYDCKKQHLNVTAAIFVPSNTQRESNRLPPTMNAKRFGTAYQ